MSVSELVKNRSELMGKIKEIDSILKEAVNAYGANLPQMPKPQNQQLSATPVPMEGRNPDQLLFGNGYKPPITPMVQPGQPAPIQQGTGYPGTPIDPNLQNAGHAPTRHQHNNPFAGDGESGFQLFDTDSWVAEQNALSMQQQPQTEYDVDSINDEAALLKQQISESIANVEDTTTTSRDGEENVPPAA